MRGVVFTELLAFIAAGYGDEMVDDVIEDSKVPNGGAYTAVGTYDHREMQALVAALAQRVGVPAYRLLQQFGRCLLCRFTERYPYVWKSQSCLFDFLESVETYIHVELEKLYPDAEFPSFRSQSRSKTQLVLDYRSCRPLADLAEGLILGASDYFGEPVLVRQSFHEDADGRFVRFTIERLP